MKDYITPKKRCNEAIINVVIWMDVLILIVSVSILIYVLIN